MNIGLRQNFLACFTYKLRKLYLGTGILNLSKSILNTYFLRIQNNKRVFIFKTIVIKNKKYIENNDNFFVSKLILSYN